MTPEQHAKVLEALEIAHDLAVQEAANVHQTYKGYKPHRHKAVDEDVQTVAEALSIMRAEGVGEPQGWKLIGWTCGDGDCGRIHDTRPDDDDGYMQPVYVMSAEQPVTIKGGNE